MPRLPSDEMVVQSQEKAVMISETPARAAFFLVSSIAAGSISEAKHSKAVLTSPSLASSLADSYLADGGIG